MPDHNYSKFIMNSTMTRRTLDQSLVVEGSGELTLNINEGKKSNNVLSE